MSSLLDVRNLSKVYSIRGGLFPRKVSEVTAVNDVSFSIKPGTSFCVMGESGSGKTTLARTILRLVEPTSGELYFAERDLLKLSAAQMRATRRDMQMVFQSPQASLNPRMTVYSALLEPLSVHKIGDKRSRSRRVAELLDLVALSGRCGDKFPYELSGGQQQRVAIARALATSPKLIVADEPTSSLDTRVQSQILDLFDRIKRDLRVAFLHITHDPFVARYRSDEVAVMYKGQIVERASTPILFASPQHPHTRELIRAAFELGRPPATPI